MLDQERGLGVSVQVVAGMKGAGDVEGPVV